MKNMGTLNGERWDFFLFVCQHSTCLDSKNKVKCNTQHEIIFIAHLSLFWGLLGKPVPIKSQYLERIAVKWREKGIAGTEEEISKVVDVLSIRGR